MRKRIRVFEGVKGRKKDKWVRDVHQRTLKCTGQIIIVPGLQDRLEVAGSLGFIILFITGCSLSLWLCLLLKKMMVIKATHRAVDQIKMSAMA